ncbi:MAG: hypothetical protein LLF96_03955 [Eubacteriales bacterium]|nr:hypothetical protein [Eubacteriales bacterium]
MIDRFNSQYAAQMNRDQPIASLLHPLQDLGKSLMNAMRSCTDKCNANIRAKESNNHLLPSDYPLSAIATLIGFKWGLPAGSIALGSGSSAEHCLGDARQADAPVILFQVFNALELASDFSL